jgi:hypothetical protein
MVTLVTSANVNPAFAVRVVDAVYIVAAWNGLWLGVHVTLPMLKSPAPVAMALGVAPITGAVTFIAAVVIGVGARTVVTVKLFVVVAKPPNVTVTGMPWCVATAKTVPSAGLAIIPSVAKPANATSLWVESL